MAWKRLARKTVYETKFIGVYEDTVELENGRVFDDYSTIQFSDSVVIVATDFEGRLIAIREYKYAVDKVILGLPAGGIEQGHNAIYTARKELLEETGYEGDEGEVIHMVHNYPSKVAHNEYTVRIRNARKVTETAHEETESIESTELIEPADIKPELFEGSYSISALACCRMFAID